MNRKIFLACCSLAFGVLVYAQTDTVAPQLLCKTLVNTPIIFCNSAFCPATYFLNDWADNATPDADIELAVRKACAGNGFPADTFTVFRWNDLYYDNAVEVWARDQAGNTSSCVVYVHPYEPNCCCDPWLSFDATMPDTAGIAAVDMNVLSSHCLLGDLTLVATTTIYGWGNFGSVPTGYHTTVTPTKDINPLNGISTLDLALIQRHILGIQPLDSPYKIIAADANQDGQVTAFDILVLKKLLLGVTDELPNGRSWRFVPRNFDFPLPANPFFLPFPEAIESPNTVEPAPQSFYFYGVKIGDVDYSADPDE